MGTRPVIPSEERVDQRRRRCRRSAFGLRPCPSPRRELRDLGHRRRVDQADDVFEVALRMDLERLAGRDQREEVRADARAARRARSRRRASSCGPLPRAAASAPRRCCGCRAQHARRKASAAPTDSRCKSATSRAGSSASSLGHRVARASRAGLDQALAGIAASASRLGARQRPHARARPPRRVSRDTISRAVRGHVVSRTVRRVVTGSKTLLGCRRGCIHRGAKRHPTWGSRAKPAPSRLRRSAAVRGRSLREGGSPRGETHGLWKTADRPFHARVSCSSDRSR